MPLNSATFAVLNESLLLKKKNRTWEKKNATVDRLFLTRKIGFMFRLLGPPRGPINISEMLKPNNLSPG